MRPNDSLRTAQQHENFTGYPSNIKKEEMQKYGEVSRKHTHI
jgi:hypothetical protein